jgi:hypothetical protein
MQACPGEDLGDLDLAQKRGKGLQTLDDVADKVGELVDRFGCLEERVGALSLALDLLHLPPSWQGGKAAPVFLASGIKLASAFGYGRAISASSPILRE